MKTRTTLLLALLLILIWPLLAQGVASYEAQKILGNHFIALNEAQTIYPEIPDKLQINFSLNTLKSYPNSWLVPLLTKRGYQYFLVQANFENEVSTKKLINEKDTLNLSQTIQALSLLKNLRTNWLNRLNSTDSYQYFFRTKTKSSQKNNFQKTVSHFNNEFLVIDWPNGVELGVINNNDDCIYYLSRNKQKKEIQLSQADLPDNYQIINHQAIDYLPSIYVLTMFYHK